MNQTITNYQLDSDNSSLLENDVVDVEAKDKKSVGTPYYMAPEIIRRKYDSYWNS